MKASLLLVAVTTLAFVAVGPARADGDVAAGATAAKKCVGCHGANGEGKKKNPPLAGMAEADFIQAMADYKSGTRDNKTMVRTAKKLDDEAVANLAAYYHSLK
jgi:cytochrome c553